jgi:hypothetical protein
LYRAVVSWTLLLASGVATFDTTAQQSFRSTLADGIPGAQPSDVELVVSASAMQRRTLLGVTMDDYNETELRHECSLLYDVPAENVDLYAIAGSLELTTVGSLELTTVLKSSVSPEPVLSTHELMRRMDDVSNADFRGALDRAFGLHANPRDNDNEGSAAEVTVHNISAAQATTTVHASVNLRNTSIGVVTIDSASDAAEVRLRSGVVHRTPIVIQRYYMVVVVSPAQPDAEPTPVVPALLATFLVGFLVWMGREYRQRTRAERHWQQVLCWASGKAVRLGPPILCGSTLDGGSLTSEHGSLRNLRSYHIFLSHVWATGQNQMRSVKDRLQAVLPGVRVFLDVRRAVAPTNGLTYCHGDVGCRFAPSEQLDDLKSGKGAEAVEYAATPP